MAVVVPVFFLLIFGLMEFGRMIMVQQALTNAAREGCRMAVLSTTIDETDVETTIRSYLQASVANAGNIGAFRVAISPESFTGIESGTEIAATIEVNFSDVSWLPANFLGGSVLQAQATMNRE
jgi:Flp pilus assembly protein TadG